jgi:propanol-preferring alcohol dehydrogenase
MSDIHFMMNDWAMPPMSQFGTQCAGHEGAGVIVQVGERVKHLKVGQRAGYKPIVDVCHACDACRGGKETYCPKAIFTGLMADGIFFPLQPSYVTNSIESNRFIQGVHCVP